MSLEEEEMQSLTEEEIRERDYIISLILEEQEIRLRFSRSHIITKEDSIRREEILFLLNKNEWKSTWGFPPRPVLSRSTTLYNGDNAISISGGIDNIENHLKKRGIIKE
jgi:hypothetical protein